jgi:hypothetical protein
MSNLNPGGSRKVGARTFGADNIGRSIQRLKRDRAADAENSIADRPHQHSREIERRLRQQARRGQ